MAWSEQRPEVLNACKQIVYACRTMSGRPDMAGRIFTHLSQIVYKLPEVVHDRSRQDVVYLYNMCAQNAWTCPAIPAIAAGQNNLSQQAVPQAHQGFCSSHVVPLVCRDDTYVTNELYCSRQCAGHSPDYLSLPLNVLSGFQLFVLGIGDPVLLGTLMIFCVCAHLALDHC